MDNSMRVQIASLVLLLYVTINYFSAKRRHTTAHKIFFGIAALSIVNVSVDHFYTVMTLRLGQPMEALFKFYLTTLGVLAFLVFLYVARNISDEGGTLHNRFYFWHILGSLALIIPFFPVRFEKVDNWQNARGWGVMACYCYMLLFISLSLFLVLNNANVLKIQAKISMLLALISLALTLTIQILEQRNLITSIGIGFMVLSMYIILENPDRLLIERLEYEKDRANSANESKSSFVAHVSHEIRTPINAILGMNEMIIRESKEEFSRQYAQDISNAAYALYGIINDVLDMSKMESGKMDIYPVEYQLNQMLYDVIKVNQSRIDAKQLDFYVEINPSLPSVLYGDDVRIKQVLSNLLSNAIKYTHEGFVRVLVDGEFKQDMIELKFSVKDTGIGIKEEDISKLFVAFERIEESRNRSIEGTGLGMNITYNLLRQMGSRLDITSVYGEGSIFSFTLTQRIVDTSPVGDFKSYSKEQRKPGTISFKAPSAKILVVDDNALNRRVFSSLLNETKINIDEAASGEECLNKIKEERYDIIFLDHMMPEMDGIETISKMKESREHYNVQTPVIMLTANALGGNDDIYKKAGFDAYLSKPIFMEELEKLIFAYIPSFKIERIGENKKKEESDADWRLRLPPIRGIEWEEAISHLPTEEILMATLKEFHRSIPAEADNLEEIFLNLESGDNLELMRIKTHALKSSAAIIGAEILSEGAREIELAAKDGDIELIREKYPYMINYYRSFEKRLEAFDFDKEPKRTDIDYPQVISLFEIVRLEMNELNRENALEAIDEIEVYAYPEDVQEKIERLKTAINGFESDVVDDIVTEVQAILRNMRNGN